MNDLQDKSREELLEEVLALRKQAEQTSADQKRESNAITASEEDLRELAPGLVGGELFLATETGKIVYANDEMCESLGYAFHELTNLSVPQFDKVYTRAKWLHLVTTLKKSGKSTTFDTEHVSKFGATTAKRAVADYISYSGKNYVVCAAKIAADEPTLEEQTPGSTSTDDYRNVLFNTISDGLIVIDTKGTIIDTNNNADRMLGAPKRDILGRSYVDPKWRLTDSQGNPLKISDHPVSIALVDESPVTNKRVAVSQSDGTLRQMYINASPVLNAERKLTGAICTMRYQTAPEEPETIKKKPSENFSVLVEMARAVLDAKTIDELERRTCELLAASDVFSLVWIGRVHKNDFRIHPSSSAGENADYLLKIKERYDDSEFGQGPTGMAVKTRGIQIVNDTQNDSSFVPWKRQAARSNILSMASFPIMSGTSVYGVLCVAARDRAHFQDAEIHFLRDVTHLLAHGIQAVQHAEELEILREKAVYLDVLLANYRQNFDAGVAVFEPKAPFMCLHASEGFKTLLDDPYRKIGVDNIFLSEFSNSCMHAELYSLVERVSESGESASAEASAFVSGRGEERFWNWSVAPIMIDGVITRVVYYAVDITEKMLGEGALLNRLPAAVYRVNLLEKKVEFVNAMGKTLFSLKRDDSTTALVPFIAEIPSEYHAVIKEQLDALAAGKKKSVSFVYGKPNAEAGETLWFQQILGGIYSENGILAGVDSVILQLAHKEGVGTIAEPDIPEEPKRTPSAPVFTPPPSRPKPLAKPRKINTFAEPAVPFYPEPARTEPEELLEEEPEALPIQERLIQPEPEPETKPIPESAPSPETPESGYIVIEFPAPAPRARKETRVANLFSGKIIAWDALALHALGIEEYVDIAGVSPSDILPPDEDLRVGFAALFQAKPGEWVSIPFTPDDSDYAPAIQAVTEELPGKKWKAILAFEVLGK